MLHAVQCTPYVVCCMMYAVRCTLYAVCCTLCAVYRTLYAVCCTCCTLHMLHAACLTLHALRCMLYTVWGMLHAACGMPHRIPHAIRQVSFFHLLPSPCQAANLERCRRFFSLSEEGSSGGAALAGQVVVPDIVPELSSGRVLTMSFEEGVGISDGPGIDELGIRRAEVTRLLSEVRRCLCPCLGP